MARTSISDPLRIAELPVGNGRLGITFCPGKKASSLYGPSWDRDLDLDLDAIDTWGANAVVSLIDDREFETLGVPRLGDAVKARGMDWVHFPIRDVDVPTPQAMEKWRALSPRLHETLETGGGIVVHCRGGLGRAGTIAALLLIETGRPAERAIRDIRAVRHGAIETDAQERWLMAHSPWGGSKDSPEGDMTSR